MKITFKNLNTNETITLGGITDEYILSKKIIGEVESEKNTIQYINLIGNKVNSTKLTKRSMAFVGAIKTSENSFMQEKRNKLNRVINPLHDLLIVYGNYCIECKPDTSIKYSDEPKENTVKYCKFLIQATAYMPLFKKINEEEAYYSESLKLPLFPLKIPPAGIAFGAKSELDTTNINNQGDVDAGFTVRFIAEKGTVTNPKITNRKTGEYIEIIIDMAKGDVVELSTVAGNKYVEFVRGNTKTDIFKMVSKKSTMSMKLNTGINDIFISAAKNKANLNTVIKFTPLFLEVQ